MDTYEQQVNAQIKQYENVTDMHAETAAAKHINDRYTKPRMRQVFGAESIIELYARNFEKAYHETGSDLIVSLGSGYGELETSIMLYARKHGLPPFRLLCADISPVLVERAQRAIQENHLTDLMVAEIVDLNKPLKIAGPAAAVMVHHALHHFVELELIFSEIDRLLHPEGRMVTCDMIGRNGHMRWPETLSVVNEVWSSLPSRYKWDNQLKKTCQNYENWDCSIEGFEGIRAQDILPLLMKRFRFEAVYANFGIVDVFVGPQFGPNFDMSSYEDRSFIEEMQRIEDTLIEQHQICPVQIMAVLRTLRAGQCPAVPAHFRTRLPGTIVRNPSLTKKTSAPVSIMGLYNNPFSDKVCHPPVALIPAGERVSFARGNVGQEVVRAGWYPPDEAFTWAWGQQSTLEFQSQDSINSISFEVLPCPLPAKNPSRLSIELNGVSIDAVDLTGQAPINWVVTLPQPVLARELVRVVLDSSHPRRPDEDGGDELRPLSYALLSIKTEWRD